MTWFRIDDKMGSHPKVLSIPRAQRLAVMGLWLAGASWCAGQLTDGLFPAYMLVEVGGSKRQAQMLVEAGLWEDRGPDGWAYHDWTDYQQTRQQVEAKRETERTRIANKRSGTRSVDTNTAPSSSPVELPDPIRSDTDTEPEATTSLAALVPPAAADEVADEFAQFWHAYPRKVGKPQALKAYRAARRKVDRDTLAAAFHVFVEAMRHRDPDKVPHAATWLNREPWHDDPQAVAPTPIRRDPHGIDWERAEREATELDRIRGLA